MSTPPERLEAFAQVVDRNAGHDGIQILVRRLHALDRGPSSSRTWPPTA